MKTRRICCTLALKNDPALIEKYEWYHRAENAWPEIIRSILGAGIQEMEIYRAGSTLFMIMDVDATFDPESKTKADAADPVVQKWERLMEAFQDLSNADEAARKWQTLSSIYRLTDAAVFHDIE